MNSRIYSIFFSRAIRVLLHCGEKPMRWLDLLSIIGIPE
jgi:hypothetical protein